MKEEVNIQWKALEHEHKKRSADWYWIVGTIALAGSAAAIVLGNTLLGVLIIIATVAVFLQTVKKPRKIAFGVSERGLHIGETFYPYKHLDSFSVTQENILVKSKKRFMPFITLPLPPEEYDEDVYTLLSTFLLEEEHEEPASEKIMEQLGF